MMLSRITIKNFKSIKNSRIDLSDFNVFIGKNNVGKTNFLDCLKFIHEFSLSPYETVINTRGEYDLIVFGRNPNLSISINLIFSNGRRRIKYNLIIDHTHIVKEEIIKGNAYLIQKEGKKLNISSKSDADVHSINVNQNTSALSLYDSQYLSYQKKFRHKEVKDLIDFVKSWRFYHLIPSDMRKTHHIKKTYDIGATGDKISLVLHTLMSEHGEFFREIEETLASGIPEIESLRSPLSNKAPTEAHIAIKEKGFDSLFTQQQMSDGTLTLLAHLLMIYSPQKKGLIGIEEPEDYIHPGLLKFLRDILKSSDTQLMAITHSPYLVDALEPEDVIIVKKIEGTSKYTKATSRKDLMMFLKELTLGGILFSGELEDNTVGKK